MIYRVVKRVMDLVMASTALVLLSPLLFVLVLSIKVDSPGPVLFRQKRVGKNRTEFFILKFRTMKIDTPNDVPTHLLNDPDLQITRVGKILRRTSLDELPQLINIIKGEMSMIGPRPALWNQYDLISERDKYGANGVPVGLTGWAQIHGRDELEIEEKAKYDGEYTERFGLVMDVLCFFGTVKSVIKAEGIVEGGTSKTQSRKYSK